MNSLDELLQEIEKRPSLYIRFRTLPALQAFLFGIIYANDFGFFLKEEERTKLERFGEWVKDRYSHKDSPLGWDKILIAFAESDEHALGLFFEEMRKFESDISG
jgi:hypothetical protein